MGQVGPTPPASAGLLGNDLSKPTGVFFPALDREELVPALDSLG